LSYLAVHINPISFALPALFGLAYPYFLVLNILMVIIWAMLLKYEAFISVVVIAIGFNHFSNYIRLAKPTNDKEGTFRVLSYNIHLFTSFESKNRSGSEKKILESLKSHKPDILCLQEVYFKGSVAERENSFRKLLGEKYYSHMKVLKSGKNRFYGIATFSRFPIVRKGEIVHPASSSLSIFTDVLINKDTFRIYNNHLQSFRLKNMERSFAIEFSSDDKETMDEVKYLSMSLKNGFIRRSMQAKMVKNHINNSPYPVIVAGDFNDTPVSYTYRKIRKGLQDSFVNSGYGAGFTYRGKYPPNRIDYILYDNTLDNSFFETIKLKYSDHYPIIAYFRKKV
jgi:endonuclease/exonuclease/phosphatase family metal-dependent hydrolase